VLLATATPLLAALGFIASCGGPQQALQARARATRGRALAAR
jgi:hypothetical protein